MRNIYLSTLALCVALAALVTPSEAQTRRRGGAARATPAQNTAATPTRQAVPLPASDAVLAVDLRRLLTEAVPRALAADPARLAAVNADIEQFKARTGIDARAFDTLTAGVRLTNPSAGVTKIDHMVAIARGTFRADVLVAAGRLAAQGRFAEQKHAGKSIYVFSLNDQIKLFGLLKMRVSDLALTVLDANTLAVGEPEAVRATIDAQAGRGRVDADLLNFARTPNDLIMFAGNVPPSFLAGIELGTPELNRAVASVRRFNGSVGTSAAGYQMQTTLRTVNATEARDLGGTLEALKQVAPMLISMSGERGKFAKRAVESLRITTQANEVQLRLELAQGDLAALLQAL
ncbi:MAG TPA: hypothetical protein VFS10_00765 [Pyrinomonadaceae bacterium]|nr:hypothetical protein [Pyrinomonadaceae bacterium]